MLVTALTSCLAILLAPSALAQSRSDGWQDLETLNSKIDSETTDQSPDDGWVALEDLEDTPSVTNDEAPLQPRADESSGWVSLESEIAGQAQPITTDVIQPTALLSAGELVDIKVTNVDSLSGAYKISSIGTLVLPLIGSVTAEGLTAAQLEEQLEQLYGAEYLVDPDIIITAREKIIGQVVITGLVNKSGPIALTAAESLASILSKSNGVRGQRSSLDAIILRKLGNRIQARRVALDGININKTPGPTIFPGDQISILERKALPEVKDNSGQFPLLDKVLSGGSLRNF